MGLLVIDKSKCKQDGFCARECPMAIIHLKEKETYPEIISGGEPSCLQCGHCVAVCPHGALSHSRIPLEECPPIEKNLVIDQDRAVQFLRTFACIKTGRLKKIKFNV